MKDEKPTLCPFSFSNPNGAVECSENCQLRADGICSMVRISRLLFSLYKELDQISYSLSDISRTIDKKGD